MHPKGFEIICISEESLTIIRFQNLTLGGFCKISEKDNLEGIILTFKFNSTPVFIKNRDEIKYGFFRFKLILNTANADTNFDQMQFELEH